MKKLLTLFLVMSPLLASAQTLRAGGDVTLLMREEASGQRSALTNFGPRVNLALNRNFELSAGYRWSYARPGNLVEIRTQIHRAFARAEFHIPLERTDFLLAAGPVGEIVQSRIFSDDQRGPYGSTQRLGVTGGAAVELPIRKLRLRAGFDVFAFRRRVDVAFGLGGTFDVLGGKR